MRGGALLPSTLHLFWDLFAVLGPGNAVILRDCGAYPIARWGTDRARAWAHAFGRFRITMQSRSNG